MTAPSVRIAVERTIEAPAADVRRVLGDPTSYPQWVEALTRFEPQPAGCHLAVVVHLGRRKVRLMRQTSDGPHRYAWTMIGGHSRIGWEFLVSGAGSGDRTRVCFAWQKHGTGSIFGASGHSPIPRAALETMAERSLERLAACSRELAEADGVQDLR